MSSSRSLRGVLAGSVVMAFLSLGDPASGVAAPSWWDCAWQWIAAQLSATSATEPAAPTPPEAGAGESQPDAGWTLDPDG